MENKSKMPAFLRSGFRILFFAAGAGSSLLMLAWLLFFTQQVSVEFNTHYWHAHEMIFGYTMAVVVGFLLTATQNWTKLKTINGYPLLFLGVVWLIARVLSVMESDYIFYQMMADLVFLIFSLLFIALPIVKAKNWQNLPIIFKLLTFVIANILFYIGALGYLENGQYLGIYIAFYTVVALILMMTRRLIPFFIENAVSANIELKNSKFLDLSSLVLFVVFAIDIIFFKTHITQISALFLFVIHSIRMIYWHHNGIWSKPLLWGLYVAYGMINFAFLLTVIDYFIALPQNTATHSFAIAIGLITLSMMSRVALGHTGRNVFSPPKALGVMFAMLVAVFIFRVIATLFWSEYYPQFIVISQLLWIAAFGLFVLIYAKMFFQKRIDGSFG
ncbi:NnrS family protein [Bathymodiolus heckerae thiotrophic gill symbiont]|uniref:NnrS family protein n=1 Tax=Bathymodiolus heckerae thiotrophic gill symbiont TaxID=1052212 RepID=UPI0010AFDDDC|nr:NnrS family protein [Bathymodiolus heckerae thiotrophic gill symbiont]SMN14700.1 NnrS protein involved in response to NO [uncultured Candidatus Thioglobus sp.]